MSTTTDTTTGSTARTPGSTVAPTVEHSAWLVPGTALEPTPEGQVLRTATGERLLVRLSGAPLAALLDAVATGVPPTGEGDGAVGDARRAWDWLLAQGHLGSPADGAAPECVPTLHLVPAEPAARRDLADGPALGALVQSLAAALDLPHRDAPEPAGSAEPAAPAGPALLRVVAPGADGRVLAEVWRTGDLVVLAPRGVGGADVRARMRAAAGRGPSARDGEAPAPGRTVVAHDDGTRAGTRLAAALVAAEVVRRSRLPAPAGPRERDDLLATVVDLDRLLVGRHPVLPVPPVPR